MSTTAFPKRSKIRLLHFTHEQRTRHVARLIAPGNEAKQEAMQGLPLFEMAVSGGWTRKAKGRA